MPFNALVYITSLRIVRYRSLTQYRQRDQHLA